MHTRTSVYSLLGVAAILMAGMAQASGEWVVRKNPGNLNCYVQPAQGLAAPSPTVLGRFASRRAACEAAVRLSVQEDAPGKGPAFTPNSQAECKLDGVVLP